MCALDEFSLRRSAIRFVQMIGVDDLGAPLKSTTTLPSRFAIHPPLHREGIGCAHFMAPLCKGARSRAPAVRDEARRKRGSNREQKECMRRAATM